MELIHAQSVHMYMQIITQYVFAQRLMKLITFVQAYNMILTIINSLDDVLMAIPGPIQSIPIDAYPKEDTIHIPQYQPTHK